MTEHYKEPNIKHKKERLVGCECRKWYAEWTDNNMLKKYLSGKVLDIGFAGYLNEVVPITEDAIGVDLNYPGYDGIHLPFDNESIDGILSSHMLEHVPTENVSKTIQEMYRVLKKDKHIVITVPHKYLYEKKACLPSLYNRDHKRFYTPSSLLSEIESALEPNSYRVELLKDNDKEFNYLIPPEKHSSGCYEILCILKKIEKPYWQLSKHTQLMLENFYALSIFEKFFDL
jgi:SAM-dependent methyltransferase